MAPLLAASDRYKNCKMWLLAVRDKDRTCEGTRCNAGWETKVCEEMMARREREKGRLKDGGKEGCRL